MVPTVLVRRSPSSGDFGKKGKQETTERLKVRYLVHADFCKNSFANPGQTAVNFFRCAERDGRIDGRLITLLENASEANPRDLVPRTLFAHNSRLSRWHILTDRGGHDDVTVRA